MANGHMVVTEKDWEKATADRRSWMIFNTLQELEQRIKYLEGTPLPQKLYSFVGGILGGALAVLTYLGITLS